MNKSKISTKVFKIPYDTVEEIPLSEYKNLHKKYWEFIAKNHLTKKPTIVNRHGKN